VVRQQWYDLVMRVRLAQSFIEGFVELWLNTGSGFVK